MDAHRLRLGSSCARRALRGVRCAALPCWRPSCWPRPAPGIHFRGHEVGLPRLAGLQAARSTHGCACGSTAAPSTWGRRREPALPRPRGRPPAGDPGRPRTGPEARALQARARASAAPAGAAGRARPARPHVAHPLHRPRLRRLRGAFARGDVGLGLLAIPGVGVYIGGLNRACSQPNLTASWVREQVAAGWHLIPTYVGLQSPTSSCGPAQSSARARPLRRDRPRRPTPSTCSGRRHRAGEPDLLRHGGLHPRHERHQRHARLPGVLDDAAARSGLRGGRLQQQRFGHRRSRRQVGTGYTEPDDIWIANWNGSKTPAIPSCRTAPGATTSASTSTAAATTRPTVG